jgi:histone-lysine N-methyltransferase SETMAR
MIPVLEAAVKDGWHHLVTVNESWFFLSDWQCRIWTLAKDEVVTKPRRDIQAAKFMFTVIWSTLGFHVMNKLPTGVRMNSEYTLTHILAQYEEKLFPEGRTAHAKRLTVHMDNCSIHTSGATEDYIKQNNMMRLRHPPYSPDLALSGFYLFPGVKKTEKSSDGRRSYLFHRLPELLKEIPIKELHKAIGAWINRLLDVSRGMEAIYLDR